MAHNYNVRLISDPLDAGQAIFWNTGKDEVFFVDVNQSELYLYTPKNHKVRKTLIGGRERLSAIFAFPVKGPKEKSLGLLFAFPVNGKKNVFVGGFKTTIITFTWNLTKNNVGSYTVLKELEEDENRAPSKICGANVDPQGILWVGTVRLDDAQVKAVPYKGCLYSLMKTQLKKHEVPDIGKVTGFAWDIKMNKMYFCDTLTTVVYSVDYDMQRRELANKAEVYDVRKNGFGGSPCGLALDNRELLWLTINGGSAVIQVDPTTNKLLQAIEMPTAQITALAFGDKSLASLYVTTSREAVNEEVPDHPAGCTFVIDISNTSGSIIPLYIP